MTELTELTIEEARDGLRKKSFSAVELTKACLKSVAEAKEFTFDGKKFSYGQIITKGGQDYIVLSKADVVKDSKDGYILIAPLEAYNETIEAGVTPRKAGIREKINYGEAKDYEVSALTFEQSSSNFGSVTEHPEKIDLNYHENENGDLMHANGLYYDPKRDVIFVSVNFYSEVWVIPHQFDTIKSKTELGDLVFRFGNPNAYGGSGDRLFFNNHHPSLVSLDLESIDNFLIYMNGFKNEQSKVYEFLLPSVFDSNPLNWISPEIIWSYTDPDLFFGKISGAYRLPNRNTLICEGDFGYWEVTHSGKIVWKFDGGTTFWRGYVYPNFIL